MHRDGSTGASQSFTVDVTEISLDKVPTLITRQQVTCTIAVASFVQGGYRPRTDGHSYGIFLGIFRLGEHIPEIQQLRYASSHDEAMG